MCAYETDIALGCKLFFGPQTTTAAASAFLVSPGQPEPRLFSPQNGRHSDVATEPTLCPFSKPFRLGF